VMGAAFAFYESAASTATKVFAAPSSSVKPLTVA